MAKREFLIRYILGRAGALTDGFDCLRALADAEKAWTRIVECSDE